MHRYVFALVLSSLLATPAFAQHDHHGEPKRAEAVEPPKVFLDKSPRIVQYQLKRLSDAQLLLVETATDDKKYLPVFREILARDGMSAADREAALAAIVTINQSNAASELLYSLEGLTGKDAASVRSLRTLAGMLLGLPMDELSDSLGALGDLTGAKSSELAAIGYAGLLITEDPADVWRRAKSSNRTADLLLGIDLIPSVAVRNAQHGRVMQTLSETDSEGVKQSAIRALASISANPSTTFETVAELVSVEAFRTPAIQTLLTVKNSERSPGASLNLVDWLVNYAENTPSELRTADEFLDAMELVDQLLAIVPTNKAVAYRSRLRETVVRVVRIRTIEEEMRYDIPYFAAEAGRPIQVVLINEDLMPHNLVFTQPGGLKEVADLGLSVGPDGGVDGKQYVPDSELVLQATPMIGADEQFQLTFDAPAEPGEYPFVCTFPRHWMRMYGVMVVVEDLNAWQKNPVEPKDPIGSNRSFVQSWNVNDFGEDLELALRGRSPEIGQRLFVEATCAQCHKAGEVATGEVAAGKLSSGNVGPELNEVVLRWKGDKAAVLREILEPSHRIAPEYVMHIVITADGQTLTGLIVSEDKDSIALLENPEAAEPTVILRDEIEGMRKTSSSMMPKGLLDQFSRDEVLEILGYVTGLQSQ